MEEALGEYLFAEPGSVVETHCTPLNLSELLLEKEGRAGALSRFATAPA